LTAEAKRGGWQPAIYLPYGHRGGSLGERSLAIIIIIVGGMLSMTFRS
jgi:hypothetical protein